MNEPKESFNKYELQDIYIYCLLMNSYLLKSHIAMQEQSIETWWGALELYLGTQGLPDPKKSKIKVVSLNLLDNCGFKYSGFFYINHHLIYQTESITTSWYCCFHQISWILSSTSFHNKMQRSFTTHSVNKLNQHIKTHWCKNLIFTFI